MRRHHACVDRPRLRAFEREALGTARGGLDARERRGIVPAPLGMPHVIRAAGDAALGPGIDDVDPQRVVDPEMRMQRVRWAPRTKSHAAYAHVASGALAHR